MNALQQSMCALELANSVRIRMALVKSNVRALDSTAGLLLVADLLDEPSEVVLAMNVGQLLRSVRRLGSVAINKLLLLVDVHLFDRRVRDLSPRQRKVLADALRCRATTVRRVR